MTMARSQWGCGGGIQIISHHSSDLHTSREADRSCPERDSMIELQCQRSPILHPGTSSPSSPYSQLGLVPHMHPNTYTRMWDCRLQHEIQVIPRGDWLAREGEQTRHRKRLDTALDRQIECIGREECTVSRANFAEASLGSCHNTTSMSQTVVSPVFNANKWIEAATGPPKGTRTAATAVGSRSNTVGSGQCCNLKRVKGRS